MPNAKYGHAPQPSLRETAIHAHPQAAFALSSIPSSSREAREAGGRGMMVAGKPDTATMSPAARHEYETTTVAPPPPSPGMARSDGGDVPLIDLDAIRPRREPLERARSQGAFPCAQRLPGVQSYCFPKQVMLPSSSAM